MNTTENETKTATHAVINLSPARMVESLLDLGRSAVDIEQHLGVDATFIPSALNDHTPIRPNEKDPLLARLRRFFLRERLKGIYRRSPFVGPDKAAERLGVPMDEFRDVQRQLLESGQLKRRTSTPSWSTVEPKVGLPEYLVDD